METGSSGVFLGFVGNGPSASAGAARQFEDVVLALLADQGARLVFRGHRCPGEPESLPLEFHVLWFPTEEALAAYLADGRRHAAIEHFGEIFTQKTVVRLDRLS